MQFEFSKAIFSGIGLHASSGPLTLLETFTRKRLLKKKKNKILSNYISWLKFWLRPRPHGMRFHKKTNTCGRGLKTCTCGRSLSPQFIMATIKLPQNLIPLAFAALFSFLFPHSPTAFVKQLTSITNFKKVVSYQINKRKCEKFEMKNSQTLKKLKKDFVSYVNFLR